MKLFDKVTIIFTVGISLIVMAIGIYMWDIFPDPMPSTITQDGEVTETISKVFAIVVFPLLMVLVTLLAIYVGKHREKFNNVNDKLMYVVCWVPAMMTITMCGSWYTNALGLYAVQGNLAYPILGVFLMLVGVAFIKVYPNAKFGIRTPWSLSTDKNWKITNVVGGIGFIIGGIAVSILGVWFMFNTQETKLFMILLIAILFLMLILPILVSYVICKVLGEGKPKNVIAAEKEQMIYKRVKVSSTMEKPSPAKSSGGAKKQTTSRNPKKNRKK